MSRYEQRGAAMISRRLSSLAAWALDSAVPRDIATRSGQAAEQWRDALAQLRVAAARWQALDRALLDARPSDDTWGDAITDEAIAKARAAAIELAGADERARVRAMRDPVTLDIACPMCHAGRRVIVVTKIAWRKSDKPEHAHGYAGHRPAPPPQLPDDIITRLRERGLLDRDAVQIARDAGMTYQAIARVIGVSRQAVHESLRRHAAATPGKRSKS